MSRGAKLAWLAAGLVLLSAAAMILRQVTDGAACEAESARRADACGHPESWRGPGYK